MRADDFLSHLSINPCAKPRSQRAAVKVSVFAFSIVKCDSPPRARYARTNRFENYLRGLGRDLAVQAIDEALQPQRRAPMPPPRRTGHRP